MAWRMRTLRRTCATIATLRRPSSVDAAMRSGWLVRNCLAAPARNGPLATSALAAPNMTMKAAVLRIGLSLAFLQKTLRACVCWRPLQGARLLSPSNELVRQLQRSNSGDVRSVRAATLSSGVTQQRQKEQYVRLQRSTIRIDEPRQPTERKIVNAGRGAHRDE